MKRVNGYYWVKYNEEWTIAEYISSKIGYWWICGSATYYIEQQLDEINETRILSPDEQVKS